MSLLRVFKWSLATAVLTLGMNLCLGKAISAPPFPSPAGEGMQVLTRGQVHEAFAETVTFDPEPGIVVPKAPPAAIEELPPEQKPEGANVAWIPGYWGWDDERTDFLWVSGIWRALPPGRQWVPGYWGQAAQGFQWTSGYWADAKVSEVQYLPEPPATVEVGPNIAAPSPDNTWLPGCWVWQTGRYAWRPGFWAAVQPDWVWVPAHYVYAPRGYVFVDGYWDYSIGRRGVLFAPVYFDAGVYSRRGFSYSPSIAIDLGVFANHLFLRPRYQHYYFGDYYAANYQGAGFYPSYSYNFGRFGYDPIYAHQRWRHRQDSGWEHRQAADFANRRDHEDVRPPRTWAAQRALGTREVGPRERSPLLAAPLEQLLNSRDGRLRFQPLDQSERRKLGQYGQDVQRFREERQRLEARAAVPSADNRSRGFEPARVRLPASPIMARSADQLGRDRAPPKAYETPKPDPRVEFRPRVNRSPDQPRPYTAARSPLDTGPALPNVQPQPRVERMAPQPQPQSTFKRSAPQPKPQPKVERSAPQSRGNPAAAPHGPAGPPPAGPNQDKHKDRG